MSGVVVVLPAALPAVAVAAGARCNGGGLLYITGITGINRRVGPPGWPCGGPAAMNWGWAWPAAAAAAIAAPCE